MSKRYNGGFLSAVWTPLALHGDRSYGSLYAWGKNDEGPLGDNTIISRSSPVQVGSFATWSQISAGSSTSLAIKTDGTLWTWGSNGSGALGNNSPTTLNRSSPVQIGSFTWSQIAVAGAQSMAIRTDGTMWAWGIAANGRLGNNTVIDRSSPVQIGALTTWSKIAANGACLAIKTDGTLWSWGPLQSGVLGTSTAIQRSSPVQVGALTNWSQIEVGSNHAMAIKTDGTLWAWGGNNEGQLSDTTITSRSSPVQVGLLAWSKIACFSHSLAIKTDGTLWAWGRNDQGQLGNNTLLAKSSPIQVGALTTWSQISSYNDNTLALKTDGTMWAWGYNLLYGELGDNTTINRSSPVQIGTLSSWTQISGGTNNFMAIEGVPF